MKYLHTERGAVSVVGAMLLLFTGYAPAADISVRFDMSFAEQVLADVCSGEEIEEAAVRASTEARQMVEHFSQFRDDFTMDAYVAARRALAACETPERDLFRMAGVIKNRDELAQSVADLAGRSGEYSEAASRMIRDYAPEELRYDGVAIPVIGSPSCGGWSNAETFYVDLPCIRGDNEGLVYLVAHETYHGVQDLFMPQPESNEIFADLIREGTALTVADFSTIENPGSYAKLSQRIDNTNRRRIGENFELFDMAMHYTLTSDEPGKVDKAYSLGFSGFFDSPFYYVGSTMTRAIDEAFGRESLVCILSLEPAQFVLAYAAAGEKLGDDAESPSLGSSVMEAARLAASDRSGYESCL